MTAPPLPPAMRVLAQEAAAKVLGYRDWYDATDYRLTGDQRRKLTAMVQAFINFAEALGHTGNK